MNEKITLQDIINLLSAKHDMTKKDAERVLNAALDAITAAMADHEKVQLSGFGTFEVKQRQARMGRNPKTREAVEIPPARVPDFKPSQNLKEIVK